MRDPDVTKTQVLFLLQEMELFSCLTHKELFKLVQQSSIQRVEKGKVIFLRGDPSEIIYVVYSGRISEYAGGLNDLEMIVKERRERDFFGEMGMLSGKAELVTAVAAVDSVLIMIPRGGVPFRSGAGTPWSISFHFHLPMRILFHNSVYVAHCR